MQDKEISLTLFNRTGTKNISIEQFNFEDISDKVKRSILNNIEDYKNNLKDYSERDYDYIVAEKERKILEVYQFNLLYKSSLLFKVFLELILNNSLPNNGIEDHSIYHSLKTRLHEMDKLSFYVIQIKNDTQTTFYFKLFSFNSLYLKKNILLKLREATKLESLDESHLNLDTNFDFYFSLSSLITPKSCEEENPEIYIKNSNNFETILNFNAIYDSHRDKIIDLLSKEQVLVNMDDFERDLKLAKYRRKYMRLKPEVIDSTLRQLDQEKINQLESQTKSLKVILGENIKFEIKSPEGVDILLDLLAQHVLVGFDDTLQQVLSKSKIE